MRKDPGIPNLFPYKDKLLAEIEERKRQREEDAERMREMARETRRAARMEKKGNNANDSAPGEGDDAQVDDGSNDDVMEDEDADESNPMAALLASARARAHEYAEENNEDDEMMDDDDYDDDDDDGDMNNDEMDQQPAVATVNDDEYSSHAPTARDPSRRAFDKAFKQVVDTADVVLYVLDARDPEGTRSRAVERQVLEAEGGNKRLILIVNKIDLVPTPVLARWLTYLRRSFPALPLRAAGGSQTLATVGGSAADNAKKNDGGLVEKRLTARSTADTLLRALKTYAGAQNLQRAVSVGVIGYPNVGKSSVINALLAGRSGGKRAACPVGAEAGVTTSLREVKVDGRLKLIDSPGIVFAERKHNKKQKKSGPVEEEARLVLLNAIPPKLVTDPIPAATLLLHRLAATPPLLDQLLAAYGIPPLFPHGGAQGSSAGAGEIATDFLIQVARRRGRLGKGGVPNLSSAAAAVLTDWRDGRIRGWVEPPEVLEKQADKTGGVKVDTQGADGEKKVVSEWAAEFKIEGLWGDGDGDGQGEYMVE